MEMYSEAHHPEPTPKRWRRLDAPAERMARVGVDADGRSAIAELVDREDVYRRDLLTWTGGRAELADIRGGRVRELTVTVFDGPRAVERFKCDGTTLAGAAATPAAGAAGAQPRSAHARSPGGQARGGAGARAAGARARRRRGRPHAAIRLRSARAPRAGRWDRLTISPSSC
jgi:hypothetical protein